MEKIYNSIRKELNDKLDIVEYKTNIHYLIDNGIVEIRGGDDQELVFMAERTDRGKFGRIGWKDHIGNRNTDGTKRRRKYGK